MFNGLDLLVSTLGWVFGGSFLFGCYLFAVALHGEPTPADEACSRIDQELDDADAFYADLERNVGI